MIKMRCNNHPQLKWDYTTDRSAVYVPVASTKTEFQKSSSVVYIYIYIFTIL
jgi:hypothetical protein